MIIQFVKMGIQHKLKSTILSVEIFASTKNHDSHTFLLICREMENPLYPGTISRSVCCLGKGSMRRHLHETTRSKRAVDNIQYCILSLEYAQGYDGWTGYLWWCSNASWSSWRTHLGRGQGNNWSHWSRLLAGI